MIRLPTHFIDAGTRDGIATIALDRPEYMNSLTWVAVEQFRQVFLRSVADSRVRGIVIGGPGRYFCTGSDIGFALRNLQTGNVGRIVEYARAVHRLFNQVDQCRKPVVARLSGATLGAGLEMALACDWIVASPGASLAFPETGLGIFPSTGGTQRTPRKIGTGLAKWLIFVGKILTARQAYEIGLVDQLVAADEVDAAIQQAIDQQRPDRTRQPMSQGLDARFATLASFFQSHSIRDITSGIASTFGDQQLARAATAVQTKAPLALAVAEKLIDEGMRLTLQDGLQMELDHLESILHTRDAYEGLSSVGNRQPSFQGR